MIRKSLFQFYFIICLVSSSTRIATKFGADVLYMNQKMFFIGDWNHPLYMSCAYLKQEATLKLDRLLRPR